MSTAITHWYLGPESAGILMTPEEFDAIDDYDENYRYELIHGVLVVGPFPPAEEAGPNEYLGHLLLSYQENHPQGKELDDTLPQQYVRTRTSRRIADRLMWTGLGRVPNLKRDPPSIAVEFVSAGRRNRKRDYADKPKEYGEAGIKEYWIFDRFERNLTVVRYSGRGQQVRVIPEGETYESPLLPGFVAPVGKVLAVADRWASRRR